MKRLSLSVKKGSKLETRETLFDEEQIFTEGCMIRS